MNEDEKQIRELCRKVEETSGIPITKAKDFERLVVMIF